MSRECEICGKTKMNGMKITRDNQGILGHNPCKREVNLQNTTIIDAKGNNKKIRVCTKCLKKLKQEA